MHLNRFHLRTKKPEKTLTTESIQQTATMRKRKRINNKTKIQHTPISTSAHEYQTDIRNCTIIDLLKVISF